MWIDTDYDDYLDYGFYISNGGVACGDGDYGNVIASNIGGFDAACCLSGVTNTIPETAATSRNLNEIICQVPRITYLPPHNLLF